MRSKIDANEYKDYILGLVFYKFLSDNEVNCLRSIGWNDDDMTAFVEDYDLETQRLDKLKQIKSACLDKMFV